MILYVCHNNEYVSVIVPKQVFGTTLVLNLRLVTKQQARGSKRIFAHGGQVDVNTTDETADGAFL